MFCSTECSCRHGSPCTCGYSPEQCAQHCTGRHNNAYILPVRYDNGGDFSVYEVPANGGNLQRTVRQVDGSMPMGPMPMGPMPMGPMSMGQMPFGQMPMIASLANLAQLSPLGTLLGASRASESDTPANTLLGSSSASASGGPASTLFGTSSASASGASAASASSSSAPFGDRIRAATSAIRDRFSALTGGSEATLGSTLGSTVSSSVDSVAALRDRFTAMADPFISRIRDMASSVRSKRDVTDYRMPILRVKEHDASSGSNRYTRYLNSRVELKTPATQEKELKEMEKATHCHSCGSKLTESTCNRCGAYQPQYVEYIEGKPVSYYPRAVQEKKNDKKKSDEDRMPRYIYDRYGHRYLENNGNLRLIAPQYQEAVVSDQPDFAGLANILSENRQIMDDLNRNGGRLLPQPIDLVSDFTKLIRDMGRAREADAGRENRHEKRSTHAVEKRPIEKKDEKPTPRSMYQVAPMRYNGQDGKLVVRVYDAKNDKTKTEEVKTEDTQSKNEQTSTTPSTTENKEEKSSDKSMPTVRKFNRNNKEFEILTFDDYKTSSDEDIRRVIEHLHGKQSW